MNQSPEPTWLKPLGRTLGWAVIAGALLMGFYIARLNFFCPRTDDATVTANVVGMAPHVSGAVVKLNVKDNQEVNRATFCLRLTRSRMPPPRRGPTRHCCWPAANWRRCPIPSDRPFWR